MPKPKTFKRIKKVLYTAGAGMLLFFCLFSAAARPFAAQAEGPVVIVSNIPQSIKDALEKVKDVATKSLTTALLTNAINLMTFSADKAAYDAAVLISSGGNGNTSLFDKRTVGKYFEDQAKGFGGEAIGLISKVGKDTGLLGNFNLCAPSNPNVLLSFKFGIKSIYEQPKPVCNWDEIGSNWSGYIAKVASGSQDAATRNQLILTQLSQAFDPRVNEFSVGLQLYTDVLAQSQSKAAIDATVYSQNNGFKSITDAITGQVTTPASLLQQKFAADLAKPGDTRSQIGQQAISSKDILLAVGTHAGSVFANTLLSKLTEKIYTGLFDFEQPDIDPFSQDSFAFSNAENARNTYSSFLTSAPLQITNFSILDDFSSCPQDNRGLYNCVADSSFVSAVSRADSGTPITIKEAVDQGLLDGGWPLIKADDHARDQDPYCYTYGYCSSNLVKLRKARVISIGWELAADSKFNSVDVPVTLKEVLDGFDNCNSAGEPDNDHPWCKLIDPNWVLKYPETQCRAQVFGQLLETGAADSRQSECVDMPSCISEDDSGNCTGGYGYCVREENIWRFRGEACEEQYASCITVQNDEKTASYLRNTTDPGPCTADNAGCQWYATQKEEQGDGTFDWAAEASVAKADVATNVYQDRIYFTAAVEDCTSEEGGCRELIERGDNVQLNIVQNSGFEDDADKSGKPDAWLFTGAGAVTSTDGTFSRTGDVAVSSGTGTITEPGVAFSQSRFYTMSFYARRSVDASADLSRLMISFSATDGSAINLAGTSAGDSCEFSDENGDGKTDSVFVRAEPTGISFQRFSCTFTSPTQGSSSAGIFGDITVEGGNAYVDDVQIEQGESATAYHTGYSSTDVVTDVVKVPPSYLGCTGSATDPAECASYAQVCTENDVGCTAYTPQNGDPTVTGVASALDYCPSVCVGYDTFKQEPTLYEPSGAFPVSFIPDSADTCTEAEVGCDEFTNLTDESLAYFTYLRACVTPDQAKTNTSSDNEAVFYTWEGSDTSGYQLKTWNLLESDLGSSSHTYKTSGGTDTDPGAAPCVNLTATADGISCADAADTGFSWDVESCDEHGDIITNPSCREFYDVNGTIHYRDWSKTVTVDAACSAYRKSTIVGDDVAEQTSNCENSGGYYDSANGSCRYYGFTDESTTCSESANGCREYTGGRSRNSRVAFEDTLEDGTSNNWDAASAATITYSNESLATDGHSLSASAPFETFVFDNGSDCSTSTGCDGTAKSLGGTCSVINGARYCGTLEGELFSGKTYTLTFWAKGTGTLTAGFDTAATGGSPSIDASFGTVELSTGWQQYSVGPLDMNATDYPSFGSGTALAFNPSATAFIDNVTLREGEQNITVIKDSWVTPASCDQSPDGADSPQYYLGCQEYTTQTGDVVDLKSFSRLCGDDKVGCQNFYMTQESDSPYAEVNNAFCSTLDGGPATTTTSCYYGTSGTAYDTSSQYLCSIGIGQTQCAFNLDWYITPPAPSSHLSFEASTVITPADADVFLVVNDAVTCASGAEGCTEFGKPTYSQDRNSTSGADSVYLMNDPDKYADILCKQDELFCSEWTGTNSTKYYFKDPGDMTCEYRTGVTVGGSQYDGWFRTGTTDFCYGTCTDGKTACSTSADCGTGTCNAGDPSYVINGNYSGVWKNGDPAYGEWVGTCTSENDSCTEFEDPLDVKDDGIYGEADGNSYFFLNNQGLDESSLPTSQQCNGQVSLKDGCSLFKDTGVSALNYQSSATEMASRHADALFGTGQFDLVDPIDCESGSSTITAKDGSSVDLCARRCVYDKGAIDDIEDGRTIAEKLSGGATASTDDLYVYGTSCYAVADCAGIQSQAGEIVGASSCGERVKDNDADITDADKVAVTRLENDTNTVLKVNRDRQCSQWLTGTDSGNVWDERTSSYRTIYSGVGLCTGYSSIGNASFCSDWKTDDPQVVLSAEKYAERDVTWHGDDYSGYAIPNLYPIETLSQANVAPEKVCTLDKYLASGEITQAQFSAHNGLACTTSFDCGIGTGFDATHPEECATNADTDYRLVLDAGSCGEDYGNSCSVGTCSKTGAACATATSCGASGGDCVVGSCYTLRVSASCTSDDQCSKGEVCQGSFCAKAESTVKLTSTFSAAGACPAGQTFTASVGYKTGSCIRGSCLLAPDGSPFSQAETEQKSCRAYPEVNSPFANSVVEEWFDTDTQKKLDSTTGTPTVDDVPYNTLSGFESATTCAPGQLCDCTYKKVSYGLNAETRYFSQDTNINTDALTKDKPGICSTGKRGASCANNDQCTFDGDPGTCDLPTREDTFLGMDGFCLERDSAININGDRAQNACITWLPVDQLSGSTDLYAKYTTAGFSTEANYCSSIQLYADVHTGKGCVEMDAGLSLSDAQSACINKATTCPPGTYAIIGHYKDTSTSIKWENPAWDGPDCTAGGGDADCPYACVPIGAVNPTTGESCDADVVSAAFGSDSDKETGIDRGDYTFDAYWVPNTAEFEAAYAQVADCVAYGREFKNYTPVDDNGVDMTAYKPVSTFGLTQQLYDDHDCGGDNCGWTQYDSDYDTYLGCKEVAQVQNDSNRPGSPWTDRLLGPKTEYTIQTASGYESFKYTRDVTTAPFGATPALTVLNGDLHPAIVAQCNNTSAEFAKFPTEFADQYQDQYYPPDGAPGSYVCPTSAAVDIEVNAQIPGGDLEKALARPFVDFSGTIFTDYEYDSPTAGHSQNLFSYSPAFADIGDPSVFMGVKDPLSQIFAQSVSKARYLDGILDENGEYNPTTGKGSTEVVDGETTDIPATGSIDDDDQWDIREKGTPPTVWALDTASCAGTECEEGTENAVTINNASTGDQSSVSFLRAYMKFYAAADKNQLPLRQVIVDWGDGDVVGSTDDKNFFKNHRGLDAGTTTSKCTLNTEWGLTDLSCDPNYFSYTHIYTCSAAIIRDAIAHPSTYDCNADANADGINDNSPCVSNPTDISTVSCTYQPRVHVRDNWGWCSGTCDVTKSTKDVDGTNGCFDGVDSLGSSMDRSSECAFGVYPDLSPELGIDPWVYYDGAITVKP